MRYLVAYCRKQNAMKEWDSEINDYKLRMAALERKDTKRYVELLDSRANDTESQES